MAHSRFYMGGALASSPLDNQHKIMTAVIHVVLATFFASGVYALWEKNSVRQVARDDADPSEIY